MKTSFLALVFIFLINNVHAQKDVECMEGIRSIENSEFMENFMLTKSTIENSIKSFKSSTKISDGSIDTESIASIKNQYESIRNEMNGLLDNLVVKLTEGKQREKYLKNPEELESIFGNQLKEIESKTNMMSMEINKITQTNLCAGLGLQEVGILISLGTELYKIINSHLTSVSVKREKFYKDCFQDHFANPKKLPAYDGV